MDYIFKPLKNIKNKCDNCFEGEIAWSSSINDAYMEWCDKCKKEEEICEVKRRKESLELAKKIQASIISLIHKYAT